MTTCAFRRCGQPATVIAQAPTGWVMAACSDCAGFQQTAAGYRIVEVLGSAPVQAPSHSWRTGGEGRDPERPWVRPGKARRRVSRGPDRTRLKVAALGGCLFLGMWLDGAFPW